jgi:hypothetical protein
VSLSGIGERLTDKKLEKASGSGHKKQGFEELLSDYET